MYGPPVPTADINGAELYFESHGEGEALLLIPGFDFGVWSFYRQMPVLAEHMRVISFDLRGSGGSSAMPKGFTIADMANDAIALLDHLGLDKVSLLGFSSGGFVAFELALRHRARISRLISVATHHGGPKAVHPKGSVFSKLAGGGVNADLSLYFSDAARESDPELCDDFVRRRAENSREGGNMMQRAAMLMRFDLREEISGLDMPALISVGKDDEVVPAGNAELLSKLLPHARVDRFQGRHLFNIEHAEHFNQSIIEFVGSTAASAAQGS